MSRAIGRAVLAAATGLGLALAPFSPAAQEIVQAVLLDLTLVEVQVIVAGTRGDEQLRCLVRAGEGRVRTVAERAVTTGFRSGRTTVVLLPLPLLEADEREFSVVLSRHETVLARTPWRPINVGAPTWPSPPNARRARGEPGPVTVAGTEGRDQGTRAVVPSPAAEIVNIPVAVSGL